MEFGVTGMRLDLIYTAARHDVTTEKNTDYLVRIWLGSKLRSLIFLGSPFNSARGHAGSSGVAAFAFSSSAGGNRAARRANIGLGDLFGVDAWFAMHAILNALQECAAAFGRHMSGRVPALVVEATQQWRETCSDIDGLVSRQPIAQRMQCCD